MKKIWKTLERAYLEEIVGYSQHLLSLAHFFKFLDKNNKQLLKKMGHLHPSTAHPLWVKRTFAYTVTSLSFECEGMIL